MRTYHERLWPGPLGWSFVAGFAAVVVIALVPAAPALGVTAGALTLVAGIATVVITSPAVSVTDGELRAGGAHIPVALLGPPAELDKAGVSAVMGPGSDARTYAVLRAWLPGAVHVAVEDPQDPTPAWLVSTRHPTALAAAIRTAQAAHSEQIG